MNKEETDLIIAEQNKSTEEILKAVAKVKADYHELCKLKDMRIAELEKENAELKEQCSILADCNTCVSDCKTENIEIKKQLTKAKEIINDLVHLGEFNEHTNEEYFNYQVHEALKNTEQFLSEVEK